MKKTNIFIFLTILTLFYIVCIPALSFPDNSNVLFEKGQSLFNEEKYKDALHYFTKAKILCRKNNHTNSLFYVKTLRRIGDCNYYLSNLKEALSSYKSALSVINHLIDKRKKREYIIHKSHILTMIGNIMKKYDCDKALAYYRESLTIYKKTGFKQGIGGCYLNIGDCTAKKGDINKAIDYTKKALEYFNKNDFYSLSIAYSNLADFYIRINDLKNAAKNLEQSILLAERGNRKRQLVLNYLKLGELKQKEKNCNEALASFKKALKLSKKLADRDAIRRALLLVASCYAIIGDYKNAYLCTLEFIENSKELFNKKLVEQIAMLENKHKTKVMKKKIEFLEQESQKQEESLLFHKTTILIALFFILVFLLLLKQRQELIENIEKKNQELETVVKTIEKVSKTDDLTNLPNRRGLAEYLDREMARALRLREKFSFAICDLDNFKAINDNFSHQVGDIILMAVSKTFYDLIRKIDIVARVGGEEFIFVFPNTELENGKKVCEKIRRAVEETEFVVHDTPIKITLTFGITEFTPEKNFDRLFYEADKALYYGKENGKNMVVTYSPILEK